MEKMFKVSAVATALVGVLSVPTVWAESETVTQEYVEEVSTFFDDSTISGNVNFFMRARDRKDIVNGEETGYAPNLDHGSIFVNLGFNSGYYNDIVGTDIVIFSTFDMWQNAAFDHEMNFVDCSKPYDAGNSCTNFATKNGVSYSTANLKFKFGESTNARVGYFQPSVPSSLGVNWSFAPGTYRGGEVGFNIADFKLGAVYADRYKAPWFQNLYEFRDGAAWAGTGSDGTAKGKDVGAIYSIGGVYNFANGISLDLAYGGLTDGDRKNYHAKVKGTTDGGIYWSPQLYVVDDKNQFDSTAFQAAFLSSFGSGPYSFRAEATYTKADSTEKRGQVGNMSYRLTEQYGGSNGAYEIWWNNRSDFNHDGEFAGFLSASRDMADIGASGLSVGISGAAGMGAKAEGYKELKEYAYSAFANYGIQAGPLEGGSVSFYFTQYYNDSDAPNWGPYSNAFQDEKDFKLVLALPFAVK
ncbi:multidrug transporter [Vibrio parahaemolyticus]|uniref:multidrug transporter n=1 Tax=Vibrio mediterranei TaxID=689 RepID=UPI0040688C5A